MISRFPSSFDREQFEEKCVLKRKKQKVNYTMIHNNVRGPDITILEERKGNKTRVKKMNEMKRDK
jgi:hypothetical protein